MIALHLVQICLVYTNTLMIQGVLSTSRWSDETSSQVREACQKIG